MKTLHLCLFFVIYLTRIDGKCVEKNKIVSISSGTSFGMCMGYCRRSINITSNPNELISLKEPNYDQLEYPIVSQKYPFSSDQWKQLINLVNSKSFQALDERIGCPDCADGGAEWIEIQWPNITKRVTFEYRKSIEGFEGLIETLRSLREKYTTNK